jgi:cation diffusion facilitator family transporter
VAGVSVLASLGLTVAKAVVGVLTGSLGLLAEAAHSGLDCVATVITWASVRASSAKPDVEHPYGHGKMENLSAFVQSVLLLITCGWVISEAVGRLVGRQGAVEVTAWSYGVLVGSIVVDSWRSRALYRAARRYGSQALEAGALHFSTDIWSSGVVLGGLVLIEAGMRMGLEKAAWRADSVAALFVAGAMLYVSVRMAKQAADFLVDRAPAGMAGELEALIRRVPGVWDVQQLRARQSGNELFIDAAIVADPRSSLQEADAIASSVEHVVTERLPNADIVIHVEPGERASQSVAEVVRELAGRMELAVHGVRVRDIQGRLYISLHVEMAGQESLEDVHQRLSELEKRIVARVANVVEVETHPEPARE